MRYAVAIAEERSFTRAARRCHVVQSALSHQIKALERELGTPLFARSSRRVEVTAAGEAFLVAARECLAAADRAATDAASAGGEIRGVLTLGMIPTVTAIDIPAALGTLRRAHPAVRIRLRSGGSDEFMSAIGRGGMDVAVLGLPETSPPRGVRSRVLARERLVAVMRADHPLAGRSLLDLEDLADAAVIDFPAGAPGRVPSDLAFRAAGLPREVAFEVMSPETMLALVRHGLGIVLLPPAVVPADEELRAIPVRDGPARVVHLAWSAFHVPPAALALLEILEAPDTPS